MSLDNDNMLTIRHKIHYSCCGIVQCLNSKSIVIAMDNLAHLS